MASGTTAGGQTMMGSEEPTASHHWSSSHGSSTHNDLSPCPQCGEPCEYCHKHNPPVPVPAPVAPLPVRSPPITATHPICVATLSLNCEEAEALAGRLAIALGQSGQDPAVVLPPYPVEEHAAQGMGVHSQGCCGRGQARND
jgi:hypothetical protein